VATGHRSLQAQIRYKTHAHCHRPRFQPSLALRPTSFYATDPVGYLDQPKFVNAAALLETDLGPLDLLHALLSIEQAMGRDRLHAPPKGPRVIDLDLLLYINSSSSLVLDDPELILPHPAMHERRFVLQPLAEIAPNLLHPTTGLTVAELLARL
jgi:2-amino-4-hydroxy-6-hydroxymethyldihydropteridine diphosphokinase